MPDRCAIYRSRRRAVQTEQAGNVTVDREMRSSELSLEEKRKEPVAEGVAALEGALPGRVPLSGVGKRMAWDVLLDHLDVTDVRSALRGIGAGGGAGGELRPSSAGNIAFCSAESSALMAVNFIAPFVLRGGLLEVDGGRLSRSSASFG